MVRARGRRQGRKEDPPPQYKLFHFVEDRNPSPGFHIHTPVLIETPIWTTIVFFYFKGFSDLEVVLKACSCSCASWWRGCRGCPSPQAICRFPCALFSQSETIVPFLMLFGALLSGGEFLECLSRIDCRRGTWAFKPVDPFTLGARAAPFIFCA